MAVVQEIDTLTNRNGWVGGGLIVELVDAQRGGYVDEVVDVGGWLLLGEVA